MASKNAQPLPPVADYGERRPIRPDRLPASPVETLDEALIRLFVLCSNPCAFSSANASFFYLILSTREPFEVQNQTLIECVSSSQTQFEFDPLT